MDSDEERISEPEEQDEILTKDQLVPGHSSPMTYTIIAVCSIAIVIFTSLAIRSGLNYERPGDREAKGTHMDAYRWINRIDTYNLESVAINRRYFWQWGWHPAQIEPITNVSLVNRTRRPFEDNMCLCANTMYRDRDTVTHAMCMDAARNSAQSRQVSADGTDVQREFVSCTYAVPYDAIFTTLAVSCFGFIAVAWYAKDVLSEPRGLPKMDELGTRIADASMIFLKEEYTWLVPFVGLLTIYLYTAVDGQQFGWRPDTAVSFLFGTALSGACGFVGMYLATEGNVRTASACLWALKGEDCDGEKEDALTAGLRVAFRTGSCMGLAVVSFGLFGLSLTYSIFGNTTAMGGFGFGASAVALFARVGGGIYTKAADVGGDLCGKVEAALDEDNPKNPATIADCVGDNVGDTAGMGADLFESFVGSIVAACVLGAAEFGERGVGLPFYISVIGLIASVIGTYKVWIPCKGKDGSVGLEELLCALSINVLVAAVIIIPSVFILCFFYLRDEADYLEVIDVNMRQKEPGARVGACVLLGLVCGVFIGKITEYFTSHSDAPTMSIAKASEYGPGPVVIQGIGMGMYSTAAPMVLIVCSIIGSYYLAGYFGTAIACVGMLSTLGVTMSTDAYGPVSDNAGGIAEMCELHESVRETTDKLDALGNTTAATGKGFANGSAVLAAVSLLAAYTNAAGLSTINLLKPVVVCASLGGALCPYIFAAMTMLSVNKAAQEMMAEVRRQFDELIDEKGRHILDPKYDGRMPDYDRCIAISTKSALKEMLLPGLLSIFSPLTVGFILGADALAGFLLGAIASGYLLGVQMSNTGGAWDNAKKYVEAGDLKLKGVVRKKKSLEHSAVVAGDTVGDPFKDTSGPALNILIKLMTQFSFVSAPLLGREWEFFWVGIVIFCVGGIFMAYVKMVVLYEAPEKPDEFYVTDAGIKEQLDFTDSLLRRMANDKSKIQNQSVLLDEELRKVKESEEPAVREAYKAWQEGQV